jgi:hypothetical protein
MDMEWVKNCPFKLSLKKARQAVVKFVSVHGIILCLTSNTYYDKY